MTEREPNPRVDTIAVILSGGAGRRFSGQDKGLQGYRGKLLIEWVINRVRPQVSNILICINRNEADYRMFDFPLIFDLEPGHQGPLAGINAAISELINNSDYHGVEQLLVCSCDSPALPDDYVAKLSRHLHHNKKEVAVVNDGQRNQNLHCLIKRSAFNSLQNFYRSGGRAMHRWSEQIELIEVDFSDEAESFLNINSPDQLP